MENFSELQNDALKQVHVVYSTLQMAFFYPNANESFKLPLNYLKKN